MKQYKYKVNGAQYDVTIDSIVGNIAKVEVNGIPFEVEMQGSSLVEEDLPTQVADEAAAPAVAPAAPAALSLSSLKSFINAPGDCILLASGPPFGPFPNIPFKLDAIAAPAIASCIPFTVPPPALSNPNIFFNNLSPSGINANTAIAYNGFVPDILTAEPTKT